MDALINMDVMKRWLQVPALTSLDEGLQPVRSNKSFPPQVVLARVLPQQERNNQDTTLTSLKMVMPVPLGISSPLFVFDHSALIFVLTVTEPHMLIYTQTQANRIIRYMYIIV